MFLVILLKFSKNGFKLILKRHNEAWEDMIQEIALVNLVII